MSWANVLLKGAPQFIGQIGSFLQANRDAKMQRKWQAYNNALTRLQNAQNQNAITTNEGMAVERSAEQAFAIRKSEYITKGSAEVSAAATGTTGRSVDLIMGDIGRNAAEADKRRAEDLEYQMLGFQQQRESSNLQTEMQIDYTHIPKPSAADLAMGLTNTVVGAWDKAGRPQLPKLGYGLPSRGPILPARSDIKNKL